MVKKTKYSIGTLVDVGNDAFKDGKKAGIKEVVEWIEHKHKARYDEAIIGDVENWYCWFNLIEWQAKLEEWG